MRSIFTLSVAAILVLSPLALVAHHSVNLFFDQGSVVEVEGTISEIFWGSPHIGFVLLAGSADGGEQWELESGAIRILDRRGINRDSFGIGDRVRVAGWPDRSGGNAMFVTNVLLPGGDELQMTARPQPLRWTH